MSTNGPYYRPALKGSVDIQLQTAFSDGNWPAVVRLADKRAKSQNDPYYEVVRACAESRLDGPLDKFAALVSMDSLVRSGAVLKDAEALELYEWACRDLRGSFSYPDTLGVLRLRWVKANPRSPAAPQSLRACIQNWDLVNAQQIAATLDKSLSSSSHRHYMYWSILLTYMLSFSDQCPPEKQKIYRLLALKQLERAAEVTESTPEDSLDKSHGKALDRGLRTDEEVIFYYHVLARHSSPEDYLQRIRSPTLGALKQFDEGRKHLLLEALRVLESRGQWETVFEFCLHALGRKETDGSPSFLAADWIVWRLVITAAAKLPNEADTFGKVQALLATFVAAVKSRKVSPLYAKNVGLALVELAFRLPDRFLPSPAGIPATSTVRVVQLALFLEQHAHDISAMDDTKGFVEQLRFDEARYLLDHVLMKQIFRKNPSPYIAALYVKLRYFLASCPHALAHAPEVSVPDHTQPVMRCKYCGGTVTTAACNSCFRLIAVLALDLYVENENEQTAKLFKEQERDANVELAIVAAMCLLRLAGFRPGYTRHPRLRNLNTPLVLQAALILDAQLHKTPDQPPLRLLLVQIYVLLGCASYAYSVWLPLGVKRTIQDALSPLFFDRISTVSPGLFAGTKPLMEPLRTYYAYSLKEPSPVKIWDAFEAGSYSSALEVTGYCDKLRRSCTLVMTVVEERRAARALGGRVDDLNEVSFLGEIFDDTELVSTVDYGSVPDLESSTAPSFAQSLGIGPPPSNTRSHLSLLAEEFLQLCAFTPSKDYKPAKPTDAADKDLVFLTETLVALHESFTKFTHLPDAPSVLTAVEVGYYNTLTLLSGLMVLGLATSRSDDLPPTFGHAAASLRTVLAELRGALELEETLGSSNDRHRASDRVGTLQRLSDPHTMAMLREAAVAVRIGASLVLAHHDNQSARDRTGKSSLHKDVVAQMKGLVKLASQLLDDAKARTALLKSELAEPGWLDRVVEWTCGHTADAADANHGTEPCKSVLRAVGGRATVEQWAGKLIESWNEGIKGWSMVRME